MGSTSLPLSWGIRGEGTFGYLLTSSLSAGLRRSGPRSARCEAQTKGRSGLPSILGGPWVAPVLSFCLSELK